MSLLAEEIVEEWLNRQGYFTIRGVKIGVDEIDILAVRKNNNDIKCRHIEIQASMNPKSYISNMPKKEQNEGKPANSMKRSEDELIRGVKEWVDKKYNKGNKIKAMKALWQGEWSKELVVWNIKYDNEIDMLKKNNIKIIKLTDIVKDMKTSKHIIKSACGGDLLELMQIDG